MIALAPGICDVVEDRLQGSTNIAWIKELLGVEACLFELHEMPLKRCVQVGVVDLRNSCGAPVVVQKGVPTLVAQGCDFLTAMRSCDIHEEDAPVPARGPSLIPRV
jgi:hypothetical protein